MNRTVLASSLVVSFASLFALGGCAAQKPVTAAPSAPAQTPSTVAASATASPELLAAVEKAKACTLDESGFDSTCDGYTAFSQDQPFFEEGKANAYLLGMLQGDDKSRLLAAEKLRSTTGDEETAATVNRILDAAEKEKNELVAHALGDLVAGLPLAKTDTLARAIKISKAHPVEAYTEQFVFGASADVGLVDYALAVSHSESSVLRNASLQLLERLASVAPEKACEAIDGLRNDSSDFVKNRATSSLARTHKCSSHYDKLLGTIAGMDVSKKSKGMSQDVGYALDSICSDKATTPAQRDKAAALSRKISDADSISVNVRYYTLSAIMTCDPKGGPAFVGRFKASKEKTLAERAKTLTASAKK